MSIFARFTNPIWYEAGKLSEPQQVFVATVINSYGYLREAVKDNLVNAFLFNQKSLLYKNFVVEKKPWVMQNVEFLIDEAVVGLLQSCVHPTEDLSGKLSNHFVSVLPGILGPIALADTNNRSKKTGPKILKETSYSTDPNEAFDQVLIKWKEILGIDNPDFLINIKESGLSESWDEFIIAFFNGFLMGLSRIDNEVIIERARGNASRTPKHLIPFYKYIINLTGQVVSPDGFDKAENEVIKAWHDKEISRTQNLIKVLIVDDSVFNRENLRDILQDVHDVQIVGEAGNGVDAIAQVEKLRPDVVLMDIDMPVLDGISATYEICKKYPKVRVIICTIQGSYVFMKKAMLAGAEDYFTFPIIDPEFVEVVLHGGDKGFRSKKTLKVVDSVDLKVPLSFVGESVINSINMENQSFSSSPELSWRLFYSVENNFIKFSVLFNSLAGLNVISPIDWIADFGLKTGFFLLKNDSVEFSCAKIIISLGVGVENDNTKELEWIAFCTANDLMDAVSGEEDDQESGVFSRIMTIMRLWRK